MTPLSNPHVGRLECGNGKHPSQFVAERLGAGAISRDGSIVTIEFEGDDDRIWLTLPAFMLPQLQSVVRELDAITIEARNDFALLLAPWKAR